MRVPSALLATVLGLPLAARAQLPPPAQPFWAGYAGDAQHTAVSPVASGALGSIRWQTKVDTRPAYTANGSLLAHYGSPVVTQANTVIVPVKRRTTGGFQLVAFAGADARKLWRFRSNYRLPPHDWVPSFGPAISPNGTLWMPAAAGLLLRRGNLDLRGGARKEYVAFYGYDNYRHDRRTYMNTVFINTPLTAGPDGAVYFGFMVTGDNPLSLVSGIARVADDGTGTWVSAVTASGDSAMTKVAHNSAPALSPDGSTLYVAVSNANGLGIGNGYLLALDSETLATVAVRRLKDPVSGLDAAIHDDGTASPTIGPDGDVFFGVLESPLGSHHFRGWLLHFDANLAPAGVPGGFGWDDTASIVPSSMVASYAGTSPYLLFVKYNDYAGAGGDGVNRIAVIDPGDQVLDPISAAPIMRPVLTVAGPTPDVDKLPLWPNAVREWCINTGAVDPATSSILVNNEDGKLYRWSMTTGTLSETIVLTAGLLEAYTPTLIGPDGSVYAINDATLFAVGP